MVTLKAPQPMIVVIPAQMGDSTKMLDWIRKVSAHVACKVRKELMQLVEILRTRMGANETSTGVICQEIEVHNLNI